MKFTKIVGSGSYLPELVLTNEDLMARGIDTSDEWIKSRTGIEQRHIASPNQVSSDLAYEACIAALKSANTKASEVDLIIVATTTPDMIFPSTACILQAKLGVTKGAAFDVQAVCTGFIYALAIADQFIKSGTSECALVVGAETFSRLLNWGDRSTCVLFGDGAGAVVVRHSPSPGILSSHLHADGTHAHQLTAPGAFQNGHIRGQPIVHMDGPQVFKFAVNAMSQVALEALAANNMTIDQVDWLLPHQANLRIINAVGEKIKIPSEKVIVTVGHHANTSAATIPLALDEANRSGCFQVGHKVLMVAMGGGFTWGSLLLEI